MQDPSNAQENISICPLCGQNLSGTELVLLDENERRTLFHMTCEQCKTAMVIMLTPGKFGFVSIGVPTDLEVAEAEAALRNETVSEDVVLEVHNILKNYSGSISDLVR